METYSKKERERYNQDRERTSRELGLSKNEYNRLRRVGQGLTEAGTNYANGSDRSGKEYSDKQYNKDVGTHFHRTKALQKKFKDLHFYHQTDPRGASLYASRGKKLDQKNYNSEGHVIY